MHEQRINQIRHIKAHQAELDQLAYYDPLTGMPNRQAFLETLQDELARSQREQRKFAVLFMDLDAFKRINDTHGHAAGDEVLRRVSAEISARKRSDDLLFRTGGEEFILLLPGTDAARAAMLAEALRERLAQSDVLAGERITVSIGVAAHLPGESIARWAGRADAALYQAKSQGRNCVVCAGDTVSNASGSRGGNLAA